MDNSPLDNLDGKSLFIFDEVFVAINKDKLIEIKPLSLEEKVELYHSYAKLVNYHGYTGSFTDWVCQKYLQELLKNS